MSDEVVDEVVEEPTDEEIQVFVEGLDEIPPEEPKEDEQIPDEFKKLTKAQLIEKIKENEQALSQANDSSRAIRDAIGELGERITPPPQQQPQQVVQQPTESEAEYEERLKNEFLDNPRKALDEHLKRQVGPLINSSASGMRQLARELIRNQKGAEAFDKYAAEIDAVASQAPIPDLINKPKEVYEGAYNQVMANHLDDLISVRVAEEVAKLQTAQQQQGSTQPSVKAPYGATQSRPAPTTKRIVLNARDKQIADMKGLDYQTYARIYKGA